ncbi:hypothetical protein [Candidatus Thermokryptus mobilis]|nr:hypothetical protein [Candidatus Thermokryptus mobilis]
MKWLVDMIEPKISNLESEASEMEEGETASIDSTLEDEIWNIIYERTLLNSRKQFTQIKNKNGDIRRILIFPNTTTYRFSRKVRGDCNFKRVGM